MSHDRSQGTVPDPKRPSSRPTPAPVNASAVKHQVQASLNRANAEQTRQKPAQRVSNPQNWRRG
jgi:hypothetical protein